MTISAKKQALQNAVKNFGFPEKYCIVTDQINGKTFALASMEIVNPEIAQPYSYPQTKTSFMSYEVLNAYLLGYSRGTKNYYK